MDNKYNFPILYGNRAENEINFIGNVCKYILSQPIEIGDKENSNDFAGIYVEGRSREFCLEDLASLWSFKTFSQKNYPIFLFLHDTEKFLEGFNKLNIKYDFRLVVNKISEINSLEEYTKFCIEKLYFLLPPEIENVLTLQSDGMLLKSGWEDYVSKNNFDWISSHWKHRAQIETLINKHWIVGYGLNPTQIGNGGFSFRKASKMREISNQFIHFTLREYGRNDNRIPMEDLFFTYFGFNSGTLKMPSLKECCQFAVDPLTLDIWNDKANLSFGFHYFRTKSEFPPCNHGL